MVGHIYLLIRSHKCRGGWRQYDVYGNYRDTFKLRFKSAIPVINIENGSSLCQQNDIGIQTTNAQHRM